VEIPRDKHLAMYRRMVTVRRFEEQHDRLLKEGKIALMGHFGTGQEAVAVGVTAPLGDDDYLFPTHRGVGEFIGKGMEPKYIWAEYLGKKAGLSKGKGGVHLADAGRGIMGLVGSLGADFAVAVGTAFSSKRLGNGRVTLCYFGEGTSNQANFHPALNMAALWQLPLVFACANNEYCELAHYSQVTATCDIAPRAEAYGIPWKIVADGNDLAQVYSAAEEAVEHARAGGGPYFLEFKTYRVAAHYSGDPGGYREPEEVEPWLEKDPIARSRQALIEQGVSEQELDGLEAEIAAELEKALEFGMQAPYPEPEELFTDVFKGVAS
jgi:TPP-dependent pyruvate/acetoin dehydrogenase alpha subunit